VWEKVKRGSIQVRGTAALELFRAGQAVEIPFPAASDIPGLGHCSTGLVEDRNFDQILKVFCESPRDMQTASVVARHETSAHQWRERLNSSLTFTPGPNSVWLSPLRRAQTFFRLTDNEAMQWLVPKEYLDSLKITIQPEIPMGHALARFAFPSVDTTAR
jgi:hypothetical protein